MPTITAKDLTKEFPRSPLEELDGLPWLPRLIDKVRALQAGTLGDYNPYPCGGDRHFLGVVGVDGDQLKAMIDSGAGDPEIGRWVIDHATPGLGERLTPLFLVFYRHPFMSHGPLRAVHGLALGMTQCMSNPAVSIPSPSPPSKKAHSSSASATWANASMRTASGSKSYIPT